MSKFSLDKHGYNTKEVDSYINNLYLKYEDKLSEQKDRVFSLKSELESTTEKLAYFMEKDRQISKALIYAVEKADEIESGAKKIYDLEIKRVRLLYRRWEELLFEVESKYPQVNTNAYIKALMDTFKNAIKDVLEQNLNLTNQQNSTTTNLKTELRNKGDNYIKNILNKMDYAFNSPKDMENEIKTNEYIKPKPTLPNPVVATHEKEQLRLNVLSNKLKNIKSDGQDLVDSYLNSELDDSFANTAYAKSITQAKNTANVTNSPFAYEYPQPNESGFDFKEALNPTEDLDEIMKAFDFFEEDKQALSAKKPNGTSDSTTDDDNNNLE